MIDEEGHNIGELERSKALELAYEKGLDLVEINPTARPPICKIMDFGRYKYETAKKQKENRVRQKETLLKEIRLSAKIGDHDITYKAKQAKEFFDQGNKVKVSMRLRGRENIFVENALQVFAKFAEQTNLEYEFRPTKQGNQITAMLCAKKVNNTKE